MTLLDMPNWLPIASAHFRREPVYARMKIGLFPKLVAIACKEAEVAKSELVGASRESHVVHARWSIMLGLRRAGLSTPKIGRLLGNRDHSTVLHGIAKTAQLRLAYPGFDALCALMEKEADEHTAPVDKRTG